MAYVFLEIPGEGVHAFNVTNDGRENTPVCGRAYACLPYEMDGVPQDKLDCWECESIIG